MQRHLLFKTKLRIHSRKRFGKSPNHCSIRDASIYFPSTSQQNAHKGSSKYVAKIKRTVVMQDGERQKVKSSLVLRVQRSSFARAPQAFSSAHTLSAALWRRWQVEASVALRRSARGTAQGSCSHLVVLSLLAAPGGASSLGTAPFCWVSSMYCCTARNTASSTSRLLRLTNSSSSGAFLTPTHTEESINTHTQIWRSHTSASGYRCEPSSSFSAFRYFVHH